jgi:hypothetical protein
MSYGTPWGSTERIGHVTDGVHPSPIRDRQVGHCVGVCPAVAAGNELPQLIVDDAVAWWTWLGGHHHDPGGVWLTLAKHGTIEPTSLTFDQALEESLCHGWIGHLRRRDEHTYQQRFYSTPGAQHVVETQRGHR